MRPTPIPDEDVWEGAQRRVIAGPDGDLTGDIRPYGPRFCMRIALEPGDLDVLVTTGPAGNRYGMRGGNWLAERQLPVDELGVALPTERETFCGYWWVAPSTAAKPCDRCGEVFVRVTIERERVA